MTKDVMIALLDQGNNGVEILEILDTILSDESVDDSDD